jgi:Ca2+:H+ antiporter
MNKQHPFGLPLWKPALYKKSRSVVRKANRALHSSPSQSSELFLNPGNLAWSLIFGWWLALVVLLVSLVMSLCGGRAFGTMLRELSSYLLWPFGRYVERIVEITPSVMNHLERESSTSVLIDDDNDFEESENDRLIHHKRKRYNWFKAVYETIKMGPVACLYYFLFFTIIGNRTCINTRLDHKLIFS